MLLLDTCVLIWLDSDPAQISRPAAEAIQQNPAGLYASSISALEIATKVRKGKLVLPMSVQEWFARVLAGHGIIELPVDSAICTASAALAPIHNDPFDRIIIATASLRALRVVTSDALIHAYPESRHLWL